MGPEIALALMALASTTGSTVSSSLQAEKARKQQKKQLHQAELARLEAERKEDLKLGDVNRARERRAAGRGKTILGGEGLGDSDQINRSVLLGQ